MQRDLVEKSLACKQVHWCSSPVVAHAAAQMSRNDPQHSTETLLLVPHYDDAYYMSGAAWQIWVKSISAACDGMRSFSESIMTDEVQALWTKATGIKKNKKALNISHKIFTRNIEDAVAYTVMTGEMRRYCFIAEPPEILETEENGSTRRLHSETGPALKWGDFTIWSIHGVPVDEQVVLRPETQTIDQILKGERNEEVRRIRMERYGMLRLMEHSVTADKRENDIECTKEFLVTLRSMAFLICHCPSTAGVYTLQVPIAIRTCEEAQNWLWGGSELLRERRLIKAILDKPKVIPQMGYEKITIHKHQYEEVVVPPMRLNIIGRS